MEGASPTEEVPAVVPAAEAVPAELPEAVPAAVDSASAPEVAPAADESAATDKVVTADAAAADTATDAAPSVAPEAAPSIDTKEALVSAIASLMERSSGRAAHVKAAATAAMAFGGWTAQGTALSALLASAAWEHDVAELDETASPWAPADDTDAEGAAMAATITKALAVGRTVRAAEVAKKLKDAADRAAKALALGSTTCWAKGVGYAGQADHTDDSAAQATALAARARAKAADSAAVEVLKLVACEAKAEGAAPKEALYAVLAPSALLPLLRSLLAAADEEDVRARSELFSAAAGVISALAADATLARLLHVACDADDARTTLFNCCAGVAERLHEAAQLELDVDTAAGGAGSDEGADAAAATDDGTMEGDAAVAAVSDAVAAVAAIGADAASAEAASEASTPTSEAGATATGGAGGASSDSGSVEESGTAKGDAAAYDAEAVEREYAAALKGIRFKAIKGLTEYHEAAQHGLKNEVDSGSASGASESRTRLKRVTRELRSLRSSLPTDSASSIFLRYDKARPYAIQALMVGPPDTPYQHGLYLFDIYCGTGYPHATPRCRITSTEGGGVYWGPNLYSDGTVCLSLLGTWGGESSAEGWTADSTLLQLLISVSALVLGTEEPYYNEPGNESYGGSDDCSRTASCGEGGWENVRLANINSAMIGMLKTPPTGFEDVVAAHFHAVRPALEATLAKWTKDAESHYSEEIGHRAELKGAIERLKEALDANDASFAKAGGAAVDKAAAAAPPAPKAATTDAPTEVEDGAVPPPLPQPVTRASSCGSTASAAAAAAPDTDDPVVVS